MNDEERDLLIQVLNATSAMAKRACATDDMLTIIFAYFAKADPARGEELRNLLGHLLEKCGHDYTAEFLGLAKRMEWALSGKDPGALSQTSQSKVALSQTHDLLARLRDLGTPPMPTDGSAQS